MIEFNCLNSMFWKVGASRLHANRNISASLPGARRSQPRELSRQPGKDAGLRSPSVLIRGFRKSESAFDLGREIRLRANRRRDSVPSSHVRCRIGLPIRHPRLSAEAPGPRRVLRRVGCAGEGRKSTGRSRRLSSAAPFQSPNGRGPRCHPENRRWGHGFWWQRGPLPYGRTRPKARLPGNQPSAETRLVRRDSLREAVFL
jgi:hypothetical protein